MSSIERLKRRAARTLRLSPPPRQRLLEQLPRGATGAEVGVWKGDFSERILRVAEPTRLHLIDPWAALDDEGYDGARYGGKLMDGQAEMDAIHAGVQKRFERERDAGRVQIHRMTSLEAAERFADGELGFVYIDGNHRYEFVKADLEAYRSKVRPGGLMAGDDYGEEGWWEDGVTRAVDEFVRSGAVEVVSLDEHQFVLRVPA